MFVIRNTTDRDVVLNDLRVILGPNKEIDLDKVALRHQIESSAKLRLMVKKKSIIIVGRDVDGLVIAAAPAQPSEEAIRHMEERLKEEFRSQLTAAMKLSNAHQVIGTPEVTPLPQPQPDQPPSQDIANLTDTIKSLLSQLKNQPMVQAVPQMTQGSTGSTRDGLSDDIASKIHAKAMKRIEEQVTGHVEHEVKVKQDDDLMKNIKALEDLI